jgi:hypothetical protein
MGFLDYFKRPGKQKEAVPSTQNGTATNVSYGPSGASISDMVNGGYVSNGQTQGKGIKYTRKNWLRRWECDGANTGWAILVSK